VDEARQGTPLAPLRARPTSFRGYLEERVTARPIVTDPDTGIPDLIRRLSDDSKRLVTDEVQLAKLETKDSLHRATRGLLWMVLAFGAAVVMFVALTILVATLLGRLNNDHMWFGALVTGILELGVGFWLVKKGLASYSAPSYTLVETRESLKDTAHWSASARR
jgi:uncharacterized membrane protein YqjE